MNQLRLILTLSLLTLSLTFSAQALEGTHFSHKNWEVACDNTGTCRAAGYIANSYDDNEEQSDLSVSVLLTRKAGANEPVTGYFSYAAEYDEEDPSFTEFELFIGNTSHGIIPINPEGLTELRPEQIQALITMAKKTNTPIFFIAGDRETRAQGILSSKGMSAALLKMDDFQKRINTPNALVTPGNKPEIGLLQAQPIPQLTIPLTLENDKNLQRHYLDQENKLLELTQNDYINHCTYEDEDEYGNIKREPMNRWEEKNNLYPLNETHILFERMCWTAAYNYGTAYWVIDKNLTTANLITTEGTDFSNGQIHSMFKGRGPADCLSLQTLSWNGKQFIETSSGTTGMCRGAPGGFWWLPTLVYDVKNENNPPLKP